MTPFQEIVREAPGFEHYGIAWGHFRVLFAICFHPECSCPCPQTGTESDNMCSALIFVSPSPACLHGTSNQQLSPPFPHRSHDTTFSPSQPHYSSSDGLPPLKMAMLMNRVLLSSCHRHLGDFSFEMITSSWIFRAL